MMATTRMWDLPQELVEKIMTRVPITSLKAVRSTCKTWDAITKNCVLSKAAATPQQFLTMNAKVYSLRFQEDFVDVSVKQVDLLNNEWEVSKVYHCDGLVLLCVAKDDPKLVLWNPYLCQTRWIVPRENFSMKDRYAIGYDDSDDSRNQKILRFLDYYTLGPERKHEVGYEIYEIRSNSWRVLEVVKNPEWSIDMNQRGLSVKGNTYFFARHYVKNHGGYGGCTEEIFLLCFDFTKERFGPRLPLPFHDSFNGFNGDLVTLSSFLRGGDDDDEQLAVLFGGFESGFFEIWVTLTVDPSRASWCKFLRVEPGPFSSYGFKLYSSRSSGSFFVDEENKVAVLFELFELDRTKTAHKAFVFGQDGSFKSSVNLGEALILEHRSPATNCLYKAARPPLVCSSSYSPSLVQVKQPPCPPKEKESNTCF
ncbi:hypothetical protein Bca101_046532 [Brassica carinata]